MKKSILVKSAIALALTAGFSSSASASCSAGSVYCGSTSMQPLSSYSSSSSLGTSYTGGSYTSSYGSSSAPTLVPFSSAAATTGPIRMNGLGSSEYLQPTSCPVNVNGLQSGQSVLGCYSVMKQSQQASRIHYGAPQTVRVVRPIIYVRYPVPTPVYNVPVPVPMPFYGPRPMCGAPMMPPPMRRCGW